MDPVDSYVSTPVLAQFGCKMRMLEAPAHAEPVGTKRSRKTSDSTGTYMYYTP
eukprot:SAG22_NODE_274_length_13178_cov_17.793715_10_plen_53_part_00